MKFLVATDSESALAEIKRILGLERVISMDGGLKEGVKEKARAGDTDTFHYGACLGALSGNHG